MPPGRNRIPPFPTAKVEELLHKFSQHRRAIQCSSCQATGHIQRNGFNRTNPAMPTFRCAKCTKNYNHVELFNRMPTASLGNSPSDIPETSPVMEELDHPVSMSSQPDETIAPQDWASQMDNQDLPVPSTALVFEHHDALPEFMKTLVTELNAQKRRLDRHDKLYDEIKRLQHELSTANQRVSELEETNAALRQQLQTQQTQGTMASIHAPRHNALDSFPSLPLQPSLPHGTSLPKSTNVWYDTEGTQRVRRAGSLVHNVRKQQAAARAFLPPSDNQGFKYVYLPARARIPTNIHYPDRQVIALLLHNDYVPDFLDALSKYGVKPIEHYDPLDPSHLRDPKYEKLSLQERVERTKEHHNQRMLRALDFIRIPVRYAVARHFLSSGWVSPDQLQNILASQQSTKRHSSRYQGSSAVDVFLAERATAEDDHMHDPDISSVMEASNSTDQFSIDE
ncbi:hypothetical protein EC973_006871 [Apophysomyces ossiformis]|uniref:Uncharacterized protein n=1 Tax=Apophysomyces ossiformis TaxID=679940 RepID=A0A8H7EJQ8_9FUNG|nr:hypothetical protein EC973_006871 [Apophysomyces ossiformis]